MTLEDKGSTFLQNASFWLPTHAMWQFRHTEPSATAVNTSQLTFSNLLHSARMEALMMATTKVTVFCEVILCGLVEIHQRWSLCFSEPKYISPRLHGVTPKSQVFTVTTKPWFKWKAGFDPRPIHVGFVVNKESEKRIFLQVLLFFFYGTTGQLGLFNPPPPGTSILCWLSAVPAFQHPLTIPVRCTYLSSSGFSNWSSPFDVTFQCFLGHPFILNPHSLGPS